MENILVDTSVWINYSKGHFNQQTDMLDEYLKFHPFHIWCCPPVIQEFLMGVKTVKEFEFYNLHFSRFMIPEMDWTAISISAAKLYFDLKKKGITIRKSNDCLIAQIAIESNATLVHNDSDFELITTGSELKTFG
ncbi:type II toxin-antitoxin system VapC family toxin [Lacihabitans soyangensis]|uniref:PIN domain nuclease n=1 Tax=Lacihabitans soyangensis TaxID=869394 RepID=A0AAE3KUV3_9BACT|nr:PIN domain-containing protein [Lacihabitans soyangensis]MCP9765997.1 PIN domain nuclease [Lacihabitans soyangensis]